MDKKSLWGKIGDLKIFETPEGLLEEQIKILRTETLSKVKGDVSKRVQYGQIKSSLFLTTSYLKDYRQEILELTHPVTGYPVRVRDNITGKKYVCPNQFEFELSIKEILMSSGVREIISAMLSYAK